MTRPLAITALLLAVLLGRTCEREAREPPYRGGELLL